MFSLTLSTIIDSAQSGKCGENEVSSEILSSWRFVETVADVLYKLFGFSKTYLLTTQYLE